MVTILGGGISGLAAAHYAVKFGIRAPKAISLVEAAPEVGGWIKSTIRPDNTLYEHGPRTIRPKGEQGAATLQLVEELGLSKKVKPIRYGHPATVNRLIYVNKQLYKLPSSLSSIFLKIKPFDKPLFLAALRDLSTPKKSCVDESIYDFVARRFGKDIAEYAISPLICGICAGDAKEVSVKFLMKSLFEAEQSHGSVLKGMVAAMFRKEEKPPSMSTLVEVAREQKWNVWSLEGGLQLLPKTMAANLKDDGVTIHLNSPCKSVSFEHGRITVKTNKDEIVSDHLISGLPAWQLAPLLSSQHPELSHLLSCIPFVTVGVVNLKFPRNVLREPAFGFLVPPSQKMPILGIVYDSCCFPTAGDCTVLTVMMGGRFLNEHFGKNLLPQTALHTAIKHAKDILGISVDPCDYNISISEKCIPQYVVGHDERRKKIYDYIKKHKLPISLVGSSYEGVGVNDVIMSSLKAVKRLSATLRS
ncbi:protoporphyrinogen oxidase [Ischnura elegans]|uniref:protoporphyrinogen oxidase n=1 Tax=Ischnura elegans TaxID=197161 RepID=UPI001ED8B26C|nr:protoporphyrinogen oxidase [Ischnura elegans]